jgi:hypothetical protein
MGALMSTPSVVLTSANLYPVDSTVVAPVLQPVTSFETFAALICSISLDLDLGTLTFAPEAA